MQCSASLAVGLQYNQQLCPGPSDPPPLLTLRPCRFKAEVPVVTALNSPSLH